MAPPARPHHAGIPVDGAVLAVREVGSGRPIVIVHGGPDFDYEYLVPELDLLADLGRVIHYAQRGRGHSYTGEVPEDVGIDREVADLDAVRAWTGADRCTVVGHSFGAVLAMEYAARHPDRISHLVLLNPAPASRADLLTLRDHLGTLRSPAQQARMAAIAADPAYAAGDPALEAERYGIHFASGFHDPGKLAVILGRLRRSFTPEAIVAARAIEDRLYAQSYGREGYDLLPRLARVRAPTLVLHGDHDFIPLEIARHIADAIRGSRLLDLPDCGHFSSLEQPDAVHRAIADLLGPVRDAARRADG